MMRQSALLGLHAVRTPELVFAVSKVAWFECTAALNGVSQDIEHVLLITAKHFIRLRLLSLHSFLSLL